MRDASVVRQRTITSCEQRRGHARTKYGTATSNFKDARVQFLYRKVIYSHQMIITSHHYYYTSKRFTNVLCARLISSSRRVDAAVRPKDHAPRSRTSECPVDRTKWRNIGIIAHINAGKTTTTERFLYLSGSTDSIGDVDRGNTVTDYLVQERDRGITITSAAVTFDWAQHKINLIDTPGHVDFTMEVERSVSVIDGALILLDSSAGVEAQTITVWNQARKYDLPNVILLNKYDKPQADYKMCLIDLNAALNINASLIQLPIKKGESISAIVDVIDRKTREWVEPESNMGKKFLTKTYDELDAKSIEKVEQLREELINKLSDLDDGFMEVVLNCDKLDQVPSSAITAALRSASLERKISPVLVGSAFKHIGVQQFLDSIISYLPSPVERELQIAKMMGVQIEESKDGDCAFIFKITHDKRLGPLSYMRVCNGAISSGTRLICCKTQQPRNIKKLHRAFGDELREISSRVEKDDIVIATGITESKTGDILGNDRLLARLVNDGTGDSRKPFKMVTNNVVAPQIQDIDPVYLCSVEARSNADQVKLENALKCFAREDPSFRHECDERGIMTIRGMGKLHLDIVRDRLKSEHQVEAMLGPLQIAYRETILHEAIEDITLDRLINGVQSICDITLRVRSKPGAGFWSAKQLRLDYGSDTSLMQLRDDHRRAIEIGLQSAFSHGPKLGCPVVDCEVQLLQFSANRRCTVPVISSVTSQCLASAIKKAKATLMEPIMRVEVVCPKHKNGPIISDMTTTRRGIIDSTLARDNDYVIIKATAPLSTLADYTEFLRRAASGRATFVMTLHEYKPMSEQDMANMARI